MIYLYILEKTTEEIASIKVEIFTMKEKCQILDAKMKQLRDSENNLKKKTAV